MTTPNPWLACYEPVVDPTLRLIGIPYAGGSAAVYRPWRGLLPPGVELWSVRMPGRESRYRERPFHRLGPLVDELVEVVVPLTDGPYAIFGHSLGALITYELARRLEREGRRPRHVFVSAHHAPQLRSPAMPMHLSPDAVILERMRRFGGTPDAFWEQPELVAAILPGLRSDFAMLETYRWTDETPLRSALTAFGGLDDVIEASTIEAWSEVVEGPFRARLFDGGHFFWSSDPTGLLAEVSSDLLSSFPELRADAATR